jgi:hypothetical protein
MIEAEQVLDHAERLLALIPRAPSRRQAGALAECAMLLADALDTADDADELTRYLAHAVPTWPRGSWGELRRVAMAWRQRRRSAATAAAAPPPAVASTAAAAAASSSTSTTTPHQSETYSEFTWRHFSQYWDKQPGRSLATAWDDYQAEQLTEFRQLPPATRSAYIEMARTRLVEHVRQNPGRNLLQHYSTEQHPLLRPEEIERTACEVWNQARHGFAPQLSTAPAQPPAPATPQKGAEPKCAAGTGLKPAKQIRPERPRAKSRAR